MVITNGDNEYDMPAFFGTLRAVPPGTDMVAFDYYSRYQRITGEGGKDLLPCTYVVRLLGWTEHF